MHMTLWKIVLGVAGIGLASAAVLLYVGFGAFLPWREAEEANRLADVAGIRPGSVVAEIGAGGGRFSLAFARRVGSTGHVYATELSEAKHAELLSRSAALRNMTVVRAEPTRTRLPDACCDVVLMRAVYHHITAPPAFIGEIRRAVKPGGRVVIIDFEPGALWFHGGRPDDAPARRPGHGVSMSEAIAEVTAAGFTLESSNPSWSRPLWMAMFRAD
jgi:SAM-dependent methyltransferase